MQPTDDTSSLHSSTYKGSNKHSQSSSSKPVKDASDRKKLKVLKNALREERSAREEQTLEITALKQRNAELEKEYNEINNKYLEVYEENDKLQEQILMLQQQTSGGTGQAKVSPS